mmetsp:Transcript_67927/g.175071  ORF Transcript_67927/g.175071 Transcript_67927/m.175071 type:complete len:327 (+) Transcript_67927:373-1353(+)
MHHDRADGEGVGGDTDPRPALEELRRCVVHRAGRPGVEARPGYRGTRGVFIATLHLVEIDLLPVHAAFYRAEYLPLGVRISHPTERRRRLLPPDGLRVLDHKVVAHAMRDAEVDQLDAHGQVLQATLLDDHVGRLEVTVDHPLRVNVQDGHCQLRSDRLQSIESQGPSLVQNRPQFAPLGQLHHDPPRASQAERLDDRDDVGARAFAHRANLRPDQLREFVLCSVVGSVALPLRHAQDLDGNLHSCRLVKSLVNLTKAPFADELAQLVLLVKVFQAAVHWSLPLLTLAVRLRPQRQVGGVPLRIRPHWRSELRHPAGRTGRRECDP